MKALCDSEIILFDDEARMVHFPIQTSEMMIIFYIKFTAFNHVSVN